MNADQDGVPHVNKGVVNSGPGTINFSGNVAIGENARVIAGRNPAGTTGPHARWDVGVITVKPVEAMAVSAMMRRGIARREQLEANGLAFEEATIVAGDRRLKLAHLQSLVPGQMSAGLAVGDLMRHYSPAVIALTGIAGGMHQDLHLADVVIGDEVINYDAYKETPDEIRRRGSAQPVPAATRRAINSFFIRYGEPGRLTAAGPDGVSRTFGVFRGPIGSGSGVIANERSNVRDYLRKFNDKTLAVETEAAGLGWALYERVSGSQTGWLAIRGISDLADADKDDSYQAVASWHAAAVLELLSPFLRPAP